MDLLIFQYLLIFYQKIIMLCQIIRIAMKVNDKRERPDNNIIIIYIKYNIIQKMEKGAQGHPSGW